jgi:hypothetical protein
MIDRKFLAVTVGAIFVLGMYGPNVAEIIQSAEAHGVQAQLQSRFIQITNEAISRQSLTTGETLFFILIFFNRIIETTLCKSRIFNLCVGQEREIRIKEEKPSDFL